MHAGRTGTGFGVCLLMDGDEGSETTAAAAVLVAALAVLPLAYLVLRASEVGVGSAVELVLEGLHLSKRLNKDAVGARSQYRARTRVTSGRR